MKKKIILIIGLFFVLSSCSEDKDISLAPVAITLNFSHSWNGTEITSADFDQLKFTNENGKIIPQRVTNMSRSIHSKITKAIKQARFLSLM